MRTKSRRETRDIFSTQKRSEVMRAIRSSGNQSTEIKLARLLRKNGLSGWRRGIRLLGRPDFVFAKERVALFVDGCFWHKCPLHCTVPHNNQEFWNRKLERNVKRDRQVSRSLRAQGWFVVRVWEHELRSASTDRLVQRLCRLLRKT